MKKLLCFFIIFIAIFQISYSFANPKIDFKNGIYHIELDGKKYARRIKFLSSPNLISNREAHIKTRAKITVNAGFFDPKNQKTISYIVEENNIIAEDPLLNENILSNSVLRKNLDKILNRTEFRIVECDNKYHYEIVPHKTPVDFACNIITSAQGGPMILPELRLEEEFFVVRDEEGRVVRESASVLHKCARTIIGLKDGNVHVIIITNDNPMTLEEVKQYCISLGLERAMAFDGGSSTSFNYKNLINVVSTKDEAGRLLKSFMIVR